MYDESIRNPKGFWSRQANLIHWQKPFEKVLDDSKPPFAAWYVGGETNLCYNAVDRHLDQLGDKPALIYVSTEVNQEKVYTFRELHQEVQIAAAMLQKMGVKKGDRVLIYMPMIPEATFAMLACARIGAI
ncbi:MAG: acetyl-coenzyme A synthetase N-terminal domain-containing protein, partial [Limnobacter sp.]